MSTNLGSFQYVVNVDNELFIKHIIYNDKYYILKSINTYYKDIKIKELVVIGKVKGVLNKI
ncbi:S24 family peptidase [Aliarcobacter trophiarum]|uniref:S24 family peptidase n=1 Tax=Aliarcobacter trophiarum TaxID=708186 RepID=UPI00397760F7